MKARRLLAVVVAVLMVVGALVARRALDDRDADPPPPTGGTPATTSAPATSVVCVEELAAVCAALARDHPDVSTSVRGAFATLDSLTAAGDPADAATWVTLQPFPGMVDAGRAARGADPLALAITDLASTPLGVAVPAGGRGAALDTACAGRALWSCIGDAAGGPWTELGGEASWGTVRPALGKVESSPVALVAFSAAVAGYFGTTDYTRSSWEADPGFSAWVRRLARAVAPSALSGATPLATMATRASSLDVAATTAAELSGLGAGADRFEAKYPEPAMSLHAVVAAPAGTDVEAIAATAAAVLVAEGWEATNGTAGPSASTTLALLQLWKEAT